VEDVFDTDRNAVERRRKQLARAGVRESSQLVGDPIVRDRTVDERVNLVVECHNTVGYCVVILL